MDSNKRYITDEIIKTLAKKMVFIGGPRQVGKTTLALSLLGSKATEKHPAYLNWDHPVMAKRIREIDLPHEPIIIFDELHKYARWRNLIKGIYDTEKSRLKIVVTGSARLDYYRKGGDSLANRYRYFRLHPFSLNEVSKNPGKKEFDRLLHFGGFPEPFLSHDQTELRLWQRDRIARVVREDLRDLEAVREVSLIEQLADMLPERIGSPLSIKGLSEDLQVDHKTADRWVQILENLYYCYRILPFGSPRFRAVKKERKLYLWDWSTIENPGTKFENLVASQLLKYCHWIEDTQGFSMELRFIRDTDRREVDFVVLKDKKPIFAMECKTGEKAISSHIEYFRQRTAIPEFYQVHQGTRIFSRENIKVMPFWTACKELCLP